MARFKIDPAQLAALKAGHLTPAPSPKSLLPVEDPEVAALRQVLNGTTGITTGNLSPRPSASPVASPAYYDDDGAVLDRRQIKILSDNQL